MIKWDKPCYKCLSHFCDLSCKEPKHLQAPQPKEPEQDQDEVDIRSRLYQRIHELETQLAQPEQEPVAYLSNKRQRLNIELKPQTFVEIPTVTDWEMPLYMKPPQRTWVGLTDEDKKQITRKANYHLEMTTGEYAERIGELTEAKLKEKNA